MGCNTSQTPLETQPHTPFETPSGEGIFPTDRQLNEFHLDGENKCLLERPTTAKQALEQKVLKNSMLIDRKGDQRVKLPPLELDPLFVRKEIPRDVEIAQEDQFSFEMDEDEEKAATKIQAVFRGHKIRKTQKIMKKQVMKTETTTPANDSTEDEREPTKEELEAEFNPNDKELCSAATKIQASFRGHMQRKLQTPSSPDDVDIDEITKKVAEELDIDLTDPELNKAATKIQASFRGHKTRRTTDDK
ncbi:igl family protein [Megaselia abdita]